MRLLRACLFITSLLVCLPSFAQQYVEVSAELDFNVWDWWFFSDKTASHAQATAPPNVTNGATANQQLKWLRSLQREFQSKTNPAVSSIFHTNNSFRCVVSTNTWLIERQSGNGSYWNASYWFTGTNIVEQNRTRGKPPFTRASESADGNPGRPVRVADLLTFDSLARICWLALCSGPSLQKPGRTIFPPSDLWKETRVAYSGGWSDDVVAFDDPLGLPRAITLTTTNGQPIVQYQVHQTTNVLGWTFPLEFYLVQYVAHGTNQWTVELTAKGRVTDIRLAQKPEIPGVEDQAHR